MREAPYHRSVSVVMPSYNERENVAEAIERVAGALGEQLLEIIVVDDDSPAGTGQVLAQLARQELHVIHRKGQSGLASALAQGTRAAKGTVVVWLDCDLGIAPEYIPELVSKLEDFDIAIGSRYVTGGNDLRSPGRALLSRILNRFAQVVLGSEITDYTSGFAAARHTALAKVPLSGEGFGEYFIDWAYRAKRNGLKIVEFGYDYRLRKSGLSKTDSNWLTFLRLGLSYTWTILRVKFHHWK